MRKLIGFMMVAAIGVAIAGITKAEGEEKAVVDVVAYAEEGGWQFLGVDGCKLCHKTAKSGDQFGQWSGTLHAKAFATLGTEEAKAVAVAAGVEGNPQEADQCLQCHVTAHGAKAELLGAKFAKEEGVGCESCHGAGSGYKAKKTMEDHAASLAGGLVVPSEALCRTCHNEKSPTYKEFDYEAALKLVAHPTPTAP